MCKLLVVPLLAGALALVTFVPRGTTAPALGDKPPRYEYAELTFSQVPERQQVLGGAGQQGPGGRRGVGIGGVSTSIRWTTGEEEIEVQEWSDLADKLKAPAPKKESPPSVHKLRVLNKLSADGWEMLDRSLADTRTPFGSVISFRRRVP
jgi:hypothetical protein